MAKKKKGWSPDGKMTHFGVVMEILLLVEGISAEKLMVLVNIIVIYRAKDVDKNGVEAPLAFLVMLSFK